MYPKGRVEFARAGAAGNVGCPRALQRIFRTVTRAQIKQRGDAILIAAGQGEQLRRLKIEGGVELRQGHPLPDALVRERPPRDFALIPAQEIDVTLIHGTWDDALR